MAAEITTISDLFTPDIWIPGAREAMATLPSILTSGAVVNTPELDAIAAGAGVAVSIPFFNDITDTADTIQVENTASETNQITTGEGIAAILNRETPFVATALSRQVNGVGDPIQEILNQIGMMRAKQRQRTLINILRGIFGTAIAANSLNKFVEVVGDQEADTHFIKADYFFDAVGALGERVSALASCVVLAHSKIVAALRKQDEIDFVPASKNGSLGLDSYKGCPIIYSDMLSRAGTTSGSVYDTYLLAPGAVAWGEKPQSNSIGDVASLVLDGDAAKNNMSIYDRTRFLMHVAGTKFVDVIGGQSATNAELADADSWQLAASSASRVPAVRIVTNG